MRRWPRWSWCCRGAGAVERTIRLDLQYEGTNYHGFGIQPGRPTIQEVLEEAIAGALGEPVRVTAAGRTDAGVHASGQVVSFRTHGRLDPKALVRATNVRLPDDVLVVGAAEMPRHFDARRSALRRHYRYTVWNRPLPSLWLRRWAWHISEPLDLARLRTASERLIGRRDFAAFVGGLAREPRGRSTTRTVERAQWAAEEGVLRFEITADAFLRQMIRGIVGTLVWVAQGRLDAEQFEEIIRAADRKRAGPNAPPAGLMLVGVDYPDEFRVPSSKVQEDEATSVHFELRTLNLELRAWSGS